MVTWAMVLETAIKWLIPVICVAIVGLITAHIIKPYKAGNAAKQQEEWDAHFAASNKPREMCDRELQSTKTELRTTLTDADTQILEQIKTISSNIEK